MNNGELNKRFAGLTMNVAMKRHAEFSFEMHINFQHVFQFCCLIARAELASESTSPGAGPIYYPIM